MNLPSSNLPKVSANKPFEIKSQGPKTEQIKKSKAKDLDQSAGNINDMES
jgi:hypothetical protein